MPLDNFFHIRLGEIDLTIWVAERANINTITRATVDAMNNEYFLKAWIDKSGQVRYNYLGIMKGSVEIVTS